MSSGRRAVDPSTLARSGRDGHDRRACRDARATGARGHAALVERGRTAEPSTLDGTTHSQAGCWKIFAVAVGQPGNLPDKPGATTSAVLTQADTNAFLTGSGDLYNLRA